MNKKAFTIMELMVVVIIVGIMAAFAIPSYTKAVQRADEKQVIINLRTIATAQEIYKAQYGKYWPVVYATPGVNHGISEINSDLKLSIQTSGTKYDYVCNDEGVSSGVVYQCWGTYSSGGNLVWQLYTNNGIANMNSGVHPTGACCNGWLNPTNPCPTVEWCW
jgi:type IV pilus assembly protein PilE